MKTREPAVGLEAHGRRVRGGEERTGHPRPAARRHWLAPHFVWQVRSELGEILCPDVTADHATTIDTGGYQVTTTLDWKMQQTAEKWLYAAARAPNPRTRRPRSRPRRARSRTGAGSRTCAARTSTTARSALSTTGPARSSRTSARAATTAPATKQFQPQFDVLADGWRQPGSSIKPINYVDRHRGPHDDRGDDVHGRRDRFRRQLRPDPGRQPERGPVRLRQALQFSLNIPSIKAGIINGLDHFYRRGPRTSASTSPRAPCR